MSDVSKFVLDGTTINVKDPTARSDSASAVAQVGTLATKVAELEALSRLTASYSSSSETITFTTGTHN